MLGAQVIAHNPAYGELRTGRCLKRGDDLRLAACADHLQELVIVEREIVTVDVRMPRQRGHERRKEIFGVDRPAVFSGVGEGFAPRAAQCRDISCFVADQAGDFGDRALRHQGKTFLRAIFGKPRKLAEYRGQKQSGERQNEGRRSGQHPVFETDVQFHKAPNL